MGRSIKRALLYIIARLAAFFFFLLPVRLAVFLGGQAGILLFYVLAKHRKQAIENLRIAFGREKTEAQIFDTAKRVFENLGKNAAEFASFSKINKNSIDGFIRVSGFKKIDQALKDQKGAVVISCHMGNWELSAAYFGLKGYPSNMIVRPLRDKRFDRLVNRMRSSKGLNAIPRDSSFKKIIAVLKSNGLVGILPDQDIGSIDGVFVKFFGKDAYTPKGPVLLAMASSAPLLAMFCIREKNRHHLIIEGPIDMQITGDREKDVLVNTQRWTDVVEKYIRRYPEQWVWMHKRWKTQPK